MAHCALENLAVFCESPSVPNDGPKHDRAWFSPVFGTRRWKRFVRGWYFVGNVRSGAAIAGSLFRHLLRALSLFSIHFVPLVPPWLLLFFFPPLRALLSLANTLNRSLLLHLCNCASLARSLSRRYNFYLLVMERGRPIWRTERHKRERDYYLGISSLYLWFDEEEKFERSSFLITIGYFHPPWLRFDLSSLAKRCVGSFSIPRDVHRV